MEKTLTGKIALITGASRGIGAAVAKCYAKAGAHVLLTARDQKALEAVDDAIQAAGGTATLIPLDLTKPLQIDQLGAHLYERFGTLDILVGNAGVLGELTPTAHLKAKIWDNIMAVNVTANFRLIRSLDPLLQQAAKTTGQAHALFTTSGIVGRNTPYWGAYAASKAALEQLVATYGAEVAHHGIFAKTIDPGVVRTAMRAKAFPGENANTLPHPDTVAERFLKAVIRAPQPLARASSE